MQKRMTTALRLTLGFGLFFVMLVVSVLLGLNRLHAVDAMIERIVTLSLIHISEPTRPY